MLDDIKDVRAVHRGYKQGNVNSEMYSIIVEFKKNNQLPNLDSSEESSSESDVDYYSSSEDDYNTRKEKKK